jgi:pyocin large subunit-like protein
MSWEASTWALSQKTGSPSGKAVLLFLANYADDKGRCWPSQNTIAKQTEQSIDTVQRRIKKLEERGLLARNRRIRQDGGCDLSFCADHIAVHESACGTKRTFPPHPRMSAIGGWSQLIDATLYL